MSDCMSRCLVLLDMFLMYVSNYICKLFHKSLCCVLVCLQILLRGNARYVVSARCVTHVQPLYLTCTGFARNVVLESAWIVTKLK